MIPPAPFWSAQPRDVVRVAGADAQRYLQGQVSQDLLPFEVGDSRWTFVLQPTGKIDVLARVWRRADDDFVLDTDAGFGETLAARLARFKIRVDATIDALAWRSVAVRGSVDDARPGGSVVGWWGRDYDVLGEAPDAPEEVAEGDVATLEAARIEAAWPAMGAEIVTGETIPAETGLADVAVSYTKGCYPGQELVERMDSRGAAAPRRVRLLDVTAGAQPGDPVVHDGKEVGRLTSVAGTRALALVRRGIDLGGDRPRT